MLTGRTTGEVLSRRTGAPSKTPDQVLRPCNPSCSLVRVPWSADTLHRKIELHRLKRVGQKSESQIERPNSSTSPVRLRLGGDAGSCLLHLRRNITIG